MACPFQRLMRLQRTWILLVLLSGACQRLKEPPLFNELNYSIRKLQVHLAEQDFHSIIDRRARPFL